MTDKTKSQPSLSLLIKLALLAWLSMIGIDFFLHAGLLAPLYAESSPFLLPPEQAFDLIPVGYASFLLLAILIVWLMAKLGHLGWRKGAKFGAQLGALAWGALILGLYSISTAPPLLLLGWFVGQTVELSVAGVVVGKGLEGYRLRSLLLRVIGLVIASLVFSILFQNLGSFGE
jgi:hypothetical protein